MFYRRLTRQIFSGFPQDNKPSLLNEKYLFVFMLTIFLVVIMTILQNVTKIHFIQLRNFRLL